MSEFNYFVKIQNLKFNVHLMREAFKKIVNKVDFDDGEREVKYISAISLNRIPNDKKSTKGKNVWGRYWTKPDHTGKEVKRAAESRYDPPGIRQEILSRLRQDAIQQGQTGTEFCNYC